MKLSDFPPIKLGHFFLFMFSKHNNHGSEGPDHQCMLKPLSETWLVQGKAHIYEFW